MPDIAIAVDHVTKRFRIPLDRSNTLKYRVVHPRSTSRFRDFLAVNDVSFDVKRGEFLGIIGHNGCGKSTLLKMLANIYKPTAGKLSVNGTVSPFLELGVGFNPELTARENIFLNGAVLGLTRRELATQIDSIIEFAGLQEHVDQKVKTFSSGMEVRLAFSVAIQANADILLMDEVLAVGDANFQAKCFDIFADYRRQGRTVILVTHDLSAVESYCDRAILLNSGSVVLDSGASEATARYRRMVGEQADRDARAGIDLSTVDTADPARWGNGAIRFTSTQLLGSDGIGHHSFVSGDSMTMRFVAHAHEDLDDFICGISLHRVDGWTVAGTNTRIAEAAAPALRAGQDAVITYTIPALRLLAGHYRMTVSLHSRYGSVIYDNLEQLVDFEVVDDLGRLGVFDMDGVWSLRREDGALPAPVDSSVAVDPAARAKGTETEGARSF